MSKPGSYRLLRMSKAPITLWNTFSWPWRARIPTVRADTPCAA